MNVWKWFTGVDEIDLRSGGDTVLRFLQAWPAWVVFLSALVAVAYVVIIYLRENPETPPVARGFLIFLRSAIILMLLAMIMVPALVLLRNIHVKSSVVVLVDNTESMTMSDGTESPVTVDASAEAGRAATVGAVIQRAGLTPDQPDEPTRYEAALAALKLDDAAGLRKLASEQQVRLFTFGDDAAKGTLAQGGPIELANIEDPDQLADGLSKLESLEIKGKHSTPTKALEGVLEKLSGQAITGILLVSDGRSTRSSDLAKLQEMARTRNVPIYALGVGSDRNPADVEILRIAGEPRAFIKEDLTVKVDLRHSGFESKTVDVRLEVKGHPKYNETQTVLLEPGKATHQVQFRLKPEEAGRYEFSASIEPMPGEFDLDNNASLPMFVEVIDRKVKVLLVDDMPRWEYQYIKNILYRDPTVLVSVLLNWADQDFAPEGDIPIRRFPATREDLAEYDVIILGDVNKQIFSQEQMENIADFVQKGGGLILIAGTRFQNPNGYAGTPLEDLLPIEIAPRESQPAGPFTVSFKPQLTLEGAVSPVMRFEQNVEKNREIWQRLHGVFWFYRCRTAKASAQVLLEHPEEVNPYTDKPYPLMMVQPVGAGKVFFSAHDSTWRWRSGTRYMTSFWIQIVRYMALPQEQATLEASAFRYVHGEQAAVHLRIADRNNIDEKEVKEIEATMLYRPSAEEAPQESKVTLTRKDQSLAVYELEFVPERVGSYEITAMPPLKSGPMATSAEFIVTPSREEFMEPARDVQYLKDVAESTGGEVIGLADVSLLAARIKANNRTTPDDKPDEIWDSPLALLVFILLIGTEWILRKRYRML